MKRTRLVQVFACLFGVVLGLLVFRELVHCCPKVTITDEQISNLHSGMSESEVIAELGVPPGDYRTTDRIFYVTMSINVVARLDPSEVRYERTWQTDERQVDVYFNREQEVVAVMPWGGFRQSTWHEKVFDWVRRHF